MPKLPTYEAGDLTIRPTEIGVDAASAAARRGGAFWNQKAAALNEQGSRLVAASRDIAGAQRGAAEGKVSIASGEAAIAAGRAAIAGSKTEQAKGTAAIASGRAEEARGATSYAEGVAAIARGDAAFAGSVATNVKEMAQRVDEFQAHRELSMGSRSLADVQNVLTNQWNDLAKRSDPNDPSVGTRFRDEHVEPTVQKFMDSFETKSGQAWALNQGNMLRQHFFNKTSADMSTMAGMAVKENINKTINTLSSTVRNDPSSLDMALRTIDTSLSAVVASSPNLDATTAASVHTEINLKAKQSVVQSFLLGVAEKNPDAIEPLLRDGKYSEFINGAEAKTIVSYARTNQRLAQSEARSARVMQDYTAKQDFHKAANELELSTAPKNAGDPPVLPPDYWQNVRKLGHMPGADLEPGRLKAMVDNGERITSRLGKPEPLGPISHENTMGLLNRMRATDDSRLTTNDEIYKAYGEGRLNTADFNFLQKEFKEMRSPEGDALSKDRAQFFKQYGRAIGGSKFDPASGTADQFAAEMDARRQEGDLRKKGLDPHLIYDPRSDYFFGKPANIAKYAGSMQTALDNAVRTTPKSVNLTGDGSTVTGISTTSAPPAEPAHRTVGSTYMTPKGELKWTGTGWVKP